METSDSQPDDPDREAEMVPKGDTDRAEAFLTLLNEHERSLTVYVLSLVPCKTDAQDILQESKLVMWRSFDDFELGTNFLAWARKVVFHQILTHRRRAKRQGVELSDDFLDSVSAEIARNSDRYDRRTEALNTCVRKLSRPHRQILLMRYSRDMDIAEIAGKVDRTEGAVYRLLSRIRSMLQDCVTRTLAKEGL